MRVVRTSPDDVFTPATARQLLALNNSIEQVCGRGHRAGG